MTAFQKCLGVKPGAFSFLVTAAEKTRRIESILTTPRRRIFNPALIAL